MFRPQKPQAPQRNRQSLETWTAAPSLDDVRSMAAEANARRGCMIDVLIKRPGCNSFVLTCQHDSGGSEPVWSLYEGEDGSKPQWTYPNDNLEMICEIICMSLPGGAASQMPTDLAPKAEPAPAPAASPNAPLPAMNPAPAAPPPNPYSQPAPGYGGYPPPQPGQGYPQQAPPQPPYTQQQQQPYQQPYPAPGAPQGYPPQPPYQQQPAPYGNQYPPPAPQQPYAQPGWGQPAAPAFTPPAPGYGQTYGNYASPPAHAPGSAQSAGAAELRPTDLAYSDLMVQKNQVNLLLGNMFIEAGVLPEPCVETALKLQELVRKGLLSSAAAIEALKKASERGGILDDDIIAACRAKYPDTTAISASQTMPAVKSAGQQLDPRELARAVVQMVQQAGIVSESDLATAEGIRRKHGGEIGNMLVAAGKMERATLDAAKRIFPLVREHRMNQEEAFRVLRHCQKTKGSVEDACRDLSIRIL